MAVHQRLDLRHSQSLVMTPQLQQAIKLLQLSNLELSDYIGQELERNPLLDQVDSAAGTAGEGEAAGTKPETLRRGDEDDYDDPRGEEDWPRGEEDWQAASGGDQDRGDLGIAPLPSTRRSEAHDSWDIEGRVSGEITLRSHLMEQARLTFDTAKDLTLAEALVDSLDEAGYLAGDTMELAEFLGVELGAVERVLQEIQGFDPAGVGARSLGECLAIQLREKNRLDPAMQALLDNLDLVAQRNFARLKGLCGVDDADLTEMLAEIRALNPRPASAFGAEPLLPVIPDVVVTRAAEGGWRVELNTETLPRILVNTTYYAELADVARDKESRSCLNEWLQSGNWLVRALHQRATTILKVASAIVESQSAFLSKGVRHLRPLTLRDIAEKIEMHESTVSRVTANKYMATPQGTVSLKYFFTASIAGSDGATHSAAAVRHRIKTLIDQEPADKVLSDDRIVELLRAEGVDIARRTVAKYREGLNIPSSVQRRRQKAEFA